MTADDIYIPPHKRVIDQSGQTSADGGGYSFLFHEKGKQGEKKENEKKKEQPPLGDPVTLNLSATVQEEIAKESQEKKKTDTPPGENKDTKDNPPETSGGHINITV
jgi:hypothetical protein